MKGFVSLAAVLALAVDTVSAHYIFDQFTAGSTEYAVYQYIRKNTNMNSPVTDLTSNDLRCNVGATGNGTDTIAMTAGEAFSFTADIAVYHQGPISMYMSKAPGAASEYDGSGDWFKILDIGPDFSTGTAVWDLAQTYSYSIPSCIEDGDYLLRIQQLAIHNPWPAGIPQFYISCAQVTVTGGSGTADPTYCQIPGAFQDTDPGYTVNIYLPDFTNYTVPGPAPFAGPHCRGSPAQLSVLIRS
ncbi:endoglucanase II [Xylaria sp. CBS 124048]|nr:endoglucanase II [Xylaria sp. CBS 124048]